MRSPILESLNLLMFYICLKSLFLQEVAVDVDSGGIIDFVFPSGYTLESYCENEKSSELTSLTEGSSNRIILLLLN